MRATQTQGYLIIGVGLGLLAGILWAPRAGKATREELRRGADKRLDVLTTKTEKVRARAGHWLGRIKEYFGRDQARHRGGLRE